MANDEGSNKEGGKGDGNGDEGGGRATVTMMMKKVRAARAMVTRVMGDEEGDCDGNDVGNDQTMKMMTTTSSCCDALLSLTSPLGEIHKI